MHKKDKRSDLGSDGKHRRFIYWLWRKDWVQQVLRVKLLGWLGVAAYGIIPEPTDVVPFAGWTDEIAVMIIWAALTIFDRRYGGTLRAAMQTDSPASLQPWLHGTTHKKP